jgi:hypothetical protein
MKFAINSVLELQRLIFPIIEAVGGPDIVDGVTKPAGEKMVTVGELGIQVFEVVKLVGQDLMDNGMVDQIDAILAESNEVWQAIEALRNRRIAGGQSEIAAAPTAARSRKVPKQD